MKAYRHERHEDDDDTDHEEEETDHLAEPVYVGVAVPRAQKGRRNRVGASAPSEGKDEAARVVKQTPVLGRSARTARSALLVR